MPYVNDVFISYRREKHAWTPWTRDIFKQALESCLQRELGEPAKVFMDEQIPVGKNYVEQLATTLATTKILVALLSKDYFSSDWCVHELDLMMERANGKDIIIPILVHDGEIIPDAVDQLQRADFKKFANPALSQAGSLHAEFWNAISQLAPRIGSAIGTAPAFDARWRDHFKQRLSEVYDASKTKTRIPPKLFVLKASAPPKTPPRLNPLG
jgi:hypothetical protein